MEHDTVIDARDVALVKGQDAGAIVHAQMLLHELAWIRCARGKNNAVSDALRFRIKHVSHLNVQ